MDEETKDEFMNVLLLLTIITTAFHGLIAGVSFDVSFVKLPTRRRIGDIAYANFARGNDLGNGKIVYPVLGIGAVILVFATIITAFMQDQPTNILLSFMLVALGTIAHSVCTAKAAPIMLSIKNTPNDKAILKNKFDTFEFWQSLRTFFQTLTFFALLWALLLVA